MKATRISRLSDAEFKKWYLCLHNRNVVRLEQTFAMLCLDCGYALDDIDAR